MVIIIYFGQYDFPAALAVGLWVTNCENSGVSESVHP